MGSFLSTLCVALSSSWVGSKDRLGHLDMSALDQGVVHYMNHVVF
jgi:hypothetical protein